METNLDVGYLDSKESQELRAKIVTEEHIQQVEETYESGTIKITQEIAKKAAHEVRIRVENTKEYTESRIDRIKKNIALYEQKDISTDAIHQVFWGAIWNSLEDWMDDLYIMFSKLPDSIELEADGNELKQYITKTLDYDEADEKSVFKQMLSFTKKMFSESYNQKDTYYFKKSDAIKSSLKSIIDNSGYNSELMEFLFLGIVSGMFVYKQDYGPKKVNKLVIREETDGSKDGKEYLGFGKIKRTVEYPNCSRFKSVDPRKLIFSKTSLSWMIEIIPTTFSNLVSQTVDEKQMPKKQASYDYAVLEKLKKHIKSEESDIFGLDQDKFYDSFYDDVSEDEQTTMFEIDGDLEVYSANNIPFPIKGKIVNCLIECVYKGEQYIPIRVQPSWFVDGSPYRVKTFSRKDGDVAGRGLPEILEPLQGILNDIENYSVDILMFSIYGVTVGDANKLQNPSKCEKIKPRDFIQLKNMEGQNIDSAFQWIHPPLDGLSKAVEFLNIFDNMLSKTSRKGPSGEKMSPNPSATEYSSIIQELQKSVNRVAINLNFMMEEMVELAFIYTMLNRTEHFDLKMSAKNLKAKATGEEIDASMSDVEKSIKLTPEELLVEGLKFKVKCLDFDANEQAVEKQQIMQAVDLLNKVGSETSTDPMTGQEITSPKVFTDESGNQYTVNDFAVYKKAFSKLGFDVSDIFIRKDESMNMAAPGNSTTAQNPGAASPGVPPMTKKPVAGDILGQAQQI